MSKKKDGKSSASKSKAESRFLDPQITNFVEGLFDFSTQAVKLAASSTGGIRNTLLKTPERLQLMGEAGTALKDMRETTGLTIDELSSAISMEDPNILKAIEDGSAALPMDIMLRLASFYSRNDPLPFVMRFSRTYHPTLSDLLNKTGIDRLMIKAEREAKFLKIYRNVDAARQLSDEGFDRVLDFTNKAFVMAMHFAAKQEEIDYQDALNAADKPESASEESASDADS